MTTFVDVTKYRMKEAKIKKKTKFIKLITTGGDIKDVRDNYDTDEFTTVILVRKRDSHYNYDFLVCWKRGAEYWFLGEAGDEFEQ